MSKALALYNRDGVSNVSIRQLAKDVGIAHSNLIYHYPTHEDIVLGLHDLMLREALELNTGLVQNDSPLKSLYETTKTGFSVVYEFRFFFKELQYICKAFSKVKEVLRQVEKVRYVMYKKVIGDMIASDLIRSEEFDGEFDDLIVRIKIYSDHWLESSSIYDDLSKEEKINKYSYLLLQHIYPYLTDKGKDEFKRIQITTTKPH
ncbi:TetR/AcrR family transcriptional regulator [Winogradskyella aurantia]|uniref:TetR/AcrR family transcriptional regulator n=1 Tax=Winogradskyella aurantia TaxID=1915063 RepID=UPI0013FD3F82|nr:TetR/AcrR family transcriptional regulator [Winogradskyella aurantia]